MKKTATVIIIIAYICAIFSFFAILGGDMTGAPKSGFGKIKKGENLNDVHCVMQSKNGEIYTLGYTCVQKFDKSGSFKGGAYYTSNSFKRIVNYEFLSLNKGNAVLLNLRENIIYIFNENFDIVDKIKVDQNYGENKFYDDYPNTDISDKQVKLSFFGNAVISENSTIKLEAPRNRLFSRDIGVLILLISIAVIFIFKEIQEKSHWFNINKA